VKDKLAIRIREGTHRRRCVVAFGGVFVVTHTSPIAINLLCVSEHRDKSSSTCVSVISIPDFIYLS
jgi:hypothetical protein